MTSSQKQIYGLIGYPVKHSLSALMHNAAFEELNIPAEYRLFEIEPSKLEGFLLGAIKVADTRGEEFNSGEVVGFNITIPHKVKAREILEKKLPLALAKVSLQDQYYVKLSGAVNTVNRENNQYYNTDAAGFLRSLQDQRNKGGLAFVPQGKSAIMLGSGGAGRAVVAALSWKNIGIKKIFVTDIDENALRSSREHFLSFPERQDLHDRLDFISAKNISDVILKCDLLVNASPVGMKEGDGSPINKQLLHKEHYVYDLVYNRETQLIRDAKEMGCAAATGGLGMLLYQGAAAFELWTGLAAPIEVMRKSLEEGVGRL